MKKVVYQTSNVCAKEIEVSVDNDIVVEVSFKGGCNGNLKAVSKLVCGMPVNEVIKRLKGNECKDKGTSCADQLCKALEYAYSLEENRV